MRRVNLVSETMFTLGSGSIGRGPLGELEDAEAPELGPDGIGSGRDQVAHLVERLGSSLARRCPATPQNPHGLDVSVPRLGLTVCFARERSPSSRHGALGIRLAFEPPALWVGAVLLRRLALVPLQVSGEPGAIRTGPRSGCLDTAARPRPSTALEPRRLEMVYEVVADEVIDQLHPTLVPDSSVICRICAFDVSV